MAQFFNQRFRLLLLLSLSVGAGASLNGSSSSPKMPRLYPSPLEVQAVADIAAYVQGF